MCTRRQKPILGPASVSHGTSAEKAAQYAASNQELEDRVRVLERIVTDSGYTLASQIEALREDRRIERPAAARPQEERIDGSR